MPKQKTYAIGIDLGGTKILAAIVDITTGEIIASARKRTRAEKGQDFVAKRTIELTQAALSAANLPQDASIVTVGVGAAGQIDRKAGVVVDAPNLGVKNMQLADILGRQFGKPVRVGNDVEVAALGEHIYGSGQGFNNFVCLFVGTGIGSGIVQNGRLYPGLTGTAGEVGHIVIQAGGRICGCGARGCLEAYASRTAITKAIMAEIHHGRSSILATDAALQLREGETIIRSGLLANAIAQGDSLVIEIVTEAADYLGYGLGSVMNFYNPQAIILGGGVIEAIDLLFERAVYPARKEDQPGGPMGSDHGKGMDAESPHIDVRAVLLEDAQALHELDYSFETDRIYTLNVRGRLTPTTGTGSLSLAKQTLSFELVETPVDPPLYKSYREFEGTPADVEARLCNVDGGYVALANERLAGVILLKVEEWRSLTRIENIIVGRQFRRYGIGSLLLNCASDWARNHGCWAILLETQNVNYPAIQFYLRNGLEVWSINQHYYPPGPVEHEIAIFMGKRLRSTP